MGPRSSLLAVTVVMGLGRALHADPAVLAAHLWGPHTLALDRDSVYFTTIGGGEVVAIAKRGGAPRILARDQTSPAELAVDADFVYWVSHGAAGGVSRVAKRGGKPDRLVDAANPYGLVSDGERLYYVAGDALYAVSKRGGAAVTLARGIDAGRPVIDDQRVYWVDLGRRAVMAVPRAGGEPRAVFDVKDGMSVAPLADLVVADGFGYLSTEKGLVRFDLGSGASGIIVSDFVEQIVVAGDRLFVSIGASSKMGPGGVTFESDGSLRVMPKAGGAPATLLERLNVRDLAVDMEAVYLLDGIGKNGRLLRLPRPR